MITLDPVTITAPPSSPQTVEIANNALYRPGKVRLANESPYLLKVQVGGDTHWLSAWTADVFACNGQSNLTVSAQLIGQSQNAPSSTLLVALAGEGEDFPGTYPIGLDRMTSIATGTVQLTASSVTINGNVPVTNPAGQQLSVQQPRKKLGTVALVAQTTNSGQFTPDAGALHLVLLLPSSAPQTTVTVVGTTTGIDYLAAINGGVAFQLSKGPFRLPVPIDPEVDATYTITVTVGVAATMTVQVSESLIGDAVDVIDGSPLSVSAAITGVPNVNISQLNGSAIQAVAGLLQIQFGGSRPWQVPLAFRGSPTLSALAAGAAAALVPGVAGQQIYVHRVSLVYDAAPAADMYLYDGVGAAFDVHSGSTQRDVDGKGVPLALGAALSLVNNSGAPRSVAFAVLYSQQ